MLRSALLLAVGCGAAWHLHVLGAANLQMPPTTCRHDSVEVSTDSPVPKLDLIVQRDAVAGWNLKIDTQHFKFSPETVNKPYSAGEGHAHLYIDGRKHARVYSNWLHIPPLGSGSHELRVTLNANDHRELALAGNVIESRASVQE